MTALENRQEAILVQLAELKNQMADLRAQLNQPVTPKVPYGKKATITSSNELMQVTFYVNCLMVLNLAGLINWISI